MVFLAVVAAILSKNQITPGFSYGELLLSTLVLVTAAFGLTAPGSIRLQRDLIWQLALTASALAGAVYSLQCGTVLFQLDQFLASFLKLGFYITSALAIGVLIRRLDQRSVARIVAAILLINALVGAYVAIAMATGGTLPYEFLWFGQNAPVTTVFFDADQQISRMRGLASEPSLFGSFQALGLAHLLLVTAWRPPVWVLAVTVISVVLSFSLTAYGLLLVTLLILFARRSENRPRLTLAGLVLFGALGISFASTQFEQAILGRVVAVGAGTDVSGLARLVATWELPLDIIGHSPWFGAGLGQMDVVFLEIGSRLKFEEILAETPQGWNVVAYVLGSLGLVGLALFVAFCIHFLRTTGSGALVFLAYLFTTGALLESPFWVFYALFYYGGSGRARARVLGGSVPTNA